MYIQANIGRNASNVPMSETAWATFQQDVKEEIVTAIYQATSAQGLGLMPLFQVHTGEGEWEGVKEESAHVSIYFDHPWEDAEFADIAHALEDRLSNLAHAYGQDAIAFVVANSHLATR